MTTHEQADLKAAHERLTAADRKQLHDTFKDEASYTFTGSDGSTWEMTADGACQRLTAPTRKPNKIQIYAALMAAGHPKAVAEAHAQLSAKEKKMVAR